jgi:energy-coupling factor transporter ATP-binding protein EcfA2
MEQETRVRYGPVPHTLFEEPLGEKRWQMAPGHWLLRGEGDHYFHYRQGEGITVERGANADLSEETLWLNGSVYSAIASMNGLVPIHASAVSTGGGVFAFTGPAGAGKSTLVAALAGLGLPMYCDDTLVLDLSAPDRIMCLPGHKRLKLRPDAVALTGAKPQEPVSRTVDKVYAVPAQRSEAISLPLAELIFLQKGEEPVMRPISGAERFVRMQDDHQTAHLLAAARMFDKAARFAHFSRLARQIAMARFVRPRDPARFADGVELVARYLRNRGAPAA